MFFQNVLVFNDSWIVMYIQWFTYMYIYIYIIRIFLYSLYTYILIYLYTYIFIYLYTYILFILFMEELYKLHNVLFEIFQNIICILTRYDYLNDMIWIIKKHSLSYKFKILMFKKE